MVFTLFPFQVPPMRTTNKTDRCRIVWMLTPWRVRWWTICLSSGDPGLIPGVGRSPLEGNGYPLQHPCLEKSMHRGAWRLQPPGSQGLGHWVTNTFPLHPGSAGTLSPQEPGPSLLCPVRSTVPSWEGPLYAPTTPFMKPCHPCPCCPPSPCANFVSSSGSKAYLCQLDRNASRMRTVSRSFPWTSCIAQSRANPKKNSLNEWSSS